MPEWILYANLALNLLILPLFKVLWDIRVKLTHVETLVEAHDARIGRLERLQDMTLEKLTPAKMT